MNRETIIKEISDIIRKYLSQDYQILLFGSWAKGDAQETSDIDIGILGKAKISWSTMVKILEAVENLPTLRKIDIVDLNSVELDFKNNILSYAKAL